MKLHLPKMLAVALLSACAAISANADVPYTGSVYTWDNTTSGTDPAFGNYALTTYDEQGNPTVTGTVISGRAGNWGNVGAIFASDNINTGNTMRFDSTHGQNVKTLNYTFTPFTVGGFIVEEGATGYTINSSGDYNRAFYLGNKDGSASYNEIHEDFAVNKTTGGLTLTLRGAETFDVAAGKTFTLKSNNTIDMSGSMNVLGGGTVNIAQGNVAMASGVTLTVQENSTLKFAGSVSGLSRTIVNDGTINFGGTVSATDLAGFEGETTYSDKDNGYIIAAEYTLIKGDGTDNLTSVTVGTSQYNVVDGVVTISDPDYTTYHLITDGASVDAGVQQAAHSEFDTIVFHAATGTVEASENASVALNLAANTTATLNVDANLTVTNNLTLSSTQGLVTTGGGSVSMGTLTVDGATVSIASSLNVTGGGDGKGADARKQGLAVTGGTVNLEGTTHISGALYASLGTVNIGNGKDEVRVTTNRVEFGDASGTGESILNVNENATLHIKGEDVADAYASTALVMGEWNGVSTANIYGKLYADNATAYVGDSTVTFNIEKGGLMAVKGFSQNQHKADKTETINLNLKDGGTLVLGANGIASQKPINVHFGAGEVGISADNVTIAKDIALSGTTTTFNTAQYVWEGSGDTRELVEGSTGGTLTITGNITGDGTITKTGEGTLVLSGTNNVLTHTIDAQEGSLTLSGGFEIGGIALVGKTVYGDGEHEGNGYATATGTVTVYSGDATVTATGATFTYHGAGVDVIDGVYTLPGTQDTTTYYINSDTDSYSWIDEHKKAELTGGIVVAAGATLKADKDMSMSVLAASSQGSVEIQEDAVVTAATGAPAVSLTGDGTYALASGTQTLGSVNTDDFDGYVRLTGEITDIDLDGNLDGKNVEFNGVSKYFKNLNEGDDATFTGDIRLADADGTAALTINNGYSRKTSTYIFSGDISGEGKWELTNGNITQHYEFQGDLSDWTGEFNISGGRSGNAQDGWHNTSLTFSNEEGTVGAAITRTGGYLDLNIKENTTFANTVTNVTSVIVEEEKTVTFNAETSIGTLAGEGDVHAEQQLTLTGRTIVSSEADEPVFSGTLSASDLVVSGVVDLGGQLEGENIRVMSGGSLALSEGSQIGDQPILNEGGTVSLSELDVSNMESQSGEEAKFDLEGHVTWDDNYYMGITADYVQVVMGGFSEGSVYWREDTYDLADNGRITLGPDQVDYNTFYVGGEISTSDINASEHAEDIANINVEYGGTLTVDAVSNATIHAGDGATVAGDHAQETVQIRMGETVEYADGIKAAEGSAEFSGNVRVTNAESESTFSVTNVNMEVQADALTYGVDANDALEITCGVDVDTITNQSGQELILNKLVTSELDGVSALSGDIVLVSTQDDLTINNLEIQAGQAVQALKGSSGAEITVTVTETLTAGGNATLLANLEMANDSALLLDAVQQGLSIGSTLTMNTGIQLDEATLRALDGMEVGNTFWLIGAAGDEPMEYIGDYGDDAWYDGVFSRISYEGDYTLQGDFNIAFSAADGFGLKKFSSTPEPTTGTLSLLALAALAARRRRK